MANARMLLKDDFFNGKITKYDYLTQMAVEHKSLFEYQELLKNTIGTKIEISEDGVVLLLENGLRLHFIEDDKGIIPAVILAMNHYEEPLWNKVKNEMGDPRVVFDIGGNVGYFSLFFSQLFPQSQFYTFEPIPNTYKYMQKNIAINNAKNIKAMNLGLTDKKQQMEMFFCPEGSGSSSLQNLLNEAGTHKIICDFNTLDSYVIENNIERIDFIKCDVEGAEKFVYEGGLKTLEKFKPVIFSEMLRKWSAKFNYHPNDIIELLKPLGYACYAISENSLTLIDKVTNDTMETNFLFKVK